MFIRSAPFCISCSAVNRRLMVPSAFDILLQVMDREPPAPSKLNRKVSQDLDYLCSRAMAKKPGQRYATAAAMAADLERYLKHEPLDLPHYSLGHRLATWWRRSPILVSHVCGIGTAAAITLPAHLAKFLIRSRRTN